MTQPISLIAKSLVRERLRTGLSLAEIARRAGRGIEVAQIAARRPNPKCETGATPITADIFDVANNPEIDVVIELIGGYTLARKAADITVTDIITSVDEPIDATQCGGKENCLGEQGRCMTHDLWAALNNHMVEFLNSVTLQKLVDDQLARGIQIEDKPVVRRAISSAPVVKPIRVNAPNSVFALGNVFSSNKS